MGVFEGASDEVARGRLVSLEEFSFSFRAKNEEWRDFSTGVSGGVYMTPGRLSPRSEFTLYLFT